MLHIYMWSYLTRLLQVSLVTCCKCVCVWGGGLAGFTPHWMRKTSPVVTENFGLGVGFVRRAVKNYMVEASRPVPQFWP